MFCDTCWSHLCSTILTSSSDKKWYLLLHLLVTGKSDIQMELSLVNMKNRVIIFSRFSSFCIQNLNYRSHLYLGAWMQDYLQLENWLFPNNNSIWCHVLITMAAWSKAWTAFARSNTGIVGSNPTWGMDVCVHLFCVFVLSCVGSGLAMGWSLIQGVLPTVYRIKKLNISQGPRGC
jgi:hypothetical protein